MENITSAVISFCEKHLGEFKLRDNQAVIKTCPFCRGGDHNDTYTFAVGLHNGAFNCMRGGCNKTGSFKELCEMFGERAPVAVSIPSAVSVKKEYALPNAENILDLTEEAKLYFAKRRISEETLNAFKVGSDKDGNIVFPFYRDKKLTYVKYRKPHKYDKNADGNRKEWQMSNTEPILFGMDNCAFGKPLFITEGQIDALSLYEAGVHNVVSVPCGCNNLEFVTLCWDWLEHFQQIVIFGDNDEPGLQMISVLTKRLGEDRCMLMPEYPEMIYDGKDYNRRCKDANEILVCYGPDVLRELAESCEPAPIKGVLNLSDVQFVDPTTVPRIYTRIPSLDNAIGGFGEGGLTILSGKRGEGKSTISSGFLLNAIQQGYKVCAYSGELSSSKFLEWILLAATESKYIGVRTDERSGKNYAAVDADIQKRIKDWMNEKFYLFDNTCSYDVPIDEAIIQIFTMCARRYGTKLFLVDNLMTVINAGEDEIKAQAKFVAALKKFAVKYSVHVLLVAHPRKTKQGENFTSDDVAGSSVITNLADVVLSIEKPNLRITKNRDFGICDYIQCTYNPVNRRIFETVAGDFTVYNWNHEGVVEPTKKAMTLPEFALPARQNDQPPQFQN